MLLFENNLIVPYMEKTRFFMMGDHYALMSSSTIAKNSKISVDMEDKEGIRKSLLVIINNLIVHAVGRFNIDGWQGKKTCNLKVELNSPTYELVRLEADTIPWKKISPDIRLAKRNCVPLQVGGFNRQCADYLDLPDLFNLFKLEHQSIDTLLQLLAKYAENNSEKTDMTYGWLVFTPDTRYKGGYCATMVPNNTRSEKITIKNGYVFEEMSEATIADYEYALIDVVADKIATDNFVQTRLPEEKKEEQSAT